MAAAELIATGTTAANSADVTVTTTAVAVALKAAADGAEVVVSLKDDGGAYNIIGRITSGSPVATVSAPGVYRFSRVAGKSCGVFSG